jgi:hypothetical protein
MPEPAPIWLHLGLYRYWLKKCGSRIMPARRDIDPAEIPLLLPYVAIVHNVEGQFRFRLAGSAVGRQFGRDLTGDVVGAHVGNPDETIVALKAVGERVFAGESPVFATGRHKTRASNLHEVSTLLLPLSATGKHAEMIILTRIACFTSRQEASRDWLAGVPFELGYVADVSSETDLNGLCCDWRSRCLGSKDGLMAQRRTTG